MTNVGCLKRLSFNLHVVYTWGIFSFFDMDRQKHSNVRKYSPGPPKPSKLIIMS